MKMIHVAPAPGKRIINPFASFAELPAAGETMPDDLFWRQREAEGGVIISDPYPGSSAEPTAIEPQN